MPALLQKPFILIVFHIIHCDDPLLPLPLPHCYPHNKDGDARRTYATPANRFDYGSFIFILLSYQIFTTSSFDDSAGTPGRLYGSPKKEKLAQRLCGQDKSLKPKLNIHTYTQTRSEVTSGVVLSVVGFRATNSSHCSCVSPKGTQNKTRATFSTAVIAVIAISTTLNGVPFW